MAEAGGASTAGESSNIEEPDEEDQFVHPRIHGKNLYVYFPLLVPVTCLIGNCKLQLKNKTWTSTVQNLRRHMRDIHKFKPDATINWCSLCDCNIGRQVATHNCFRECKYFVNSKKKLDCKCEECGETYPTWRGLSNHKKAHKAAKIQEEYNRKNGLPVTDTSADPGGDNTSIKDAIENVDKQRRLVSM